MTDTKLLYLLLLEEYYKMPNETEWVEEISTLKKILKKYAKVPSSEILGIRATEVKPGFNSQFKALYEEGLVWDSTIATKPMDVPVWPYTLDYKIPHECKVDSCPTEAFQASGKSH